MEWSSTVNPVTVLHFINTITSLTLCRTESKKTTQQNSSPGYSGGHLPVILKRHTEKSGLILSTIPDPKSWMQEEHMKKWKKKLTVTEPHAECGHEFWGGCF